LRAFVLPKKRALKKWHVHSHVMCAAVMLTMAGGLADPAHSHLCLGVKALLL
jgi:hypothetical protein